MILEQKTKLKKSLVVTNTKQVKSGELLVGKFSKSLNKHIMERTSKSPINALTKSLFHDWNKETLPKSLMMANKTGCWYGQLSELQDQFDMLKERFDSVDKTEDENEKTKDESKKKKAEKEMKKWLYIFNNKNMYSGLSDILHLALCCFMKSPLEATAETSGSLIN